MLLFFGLAHLCYIWLFWKHLAVRRFPAWALVYAVWWVGLLLVLWPRLGALSIAVAVYGLVLGGTAAWRRGVTRWSCGEVRSSSSRIRSSPSGSSCPDAMPPWTSPLVMLTYTLGQGLIAAGAIVTLRRREGVA